MGTGERTAPLGHISKTAPFKVPYFRIELLGHEPRHVMSAGSTQQHVRLRPEPTAVATREQLKPSESVFLSQIVSFAPSPTRGAHEWLILFSPGFAGEGGGREGEGERRHLEAATDATRDAIIL